MSIFHYGCHRENEVIDSLVDRTGKIGTSFELVWLSSFLQVFLRRGKTDGTGWWGSQKTLGPHSPHWRQQNSLKIGSDSFWWVTSPDTNENSLEIDCWKPVFKKKTQCMKKNPLIPPSKAQDVDLRRTVVTNPVNPT